MSDYLVWSPLNKTSRRFMPSWLDFAKFLTRGWVLSEKSGGIVGLTSKTLTLKDQNLLFSLPYLWPDQKLDTSFKTRPLFFKSISCFRPVLKLVFKPIFKALWRTFVAGFVDDDEKVAFPKKAYPIQVYMVECKNSTPTWDQNAKLDTLFMTARKSHPLGTHIPIYSPY